jgi:poly-gamma-glutamate capsule biosynthesis protein CapA/YwtB (metallophosphatase superfamily)
MRINFFGDIALHNINLDIFTLSKEIKKLITQGNLNIGNFECPITKCDDKIENHPVHLKCEVESLKILEGFHAFSLANNHLLDYGVNGLHDTMENLRKNGFDYFGGGMDQEEAMNPLVIIKEDIKIAFLGATRFSFANKNSPGPAKDSLHPLKKSIQRLKKENCFVVILFHWGYEYVPYPAPRERRIAHKCIDYGADLIVGTHPHIMQGFEKYRDKYIFYSLGNFIFDPNVFDGVSYYDNDQRIFRSFIVSLELNADHGYAFQIYPFKTSGQSVEMLSGSDKDEMLQELNTISKVFYESYCRYLKAYFQYAAEISGQNRKILINYTLKRKWDLWTVIKLYSRANYQDVLNKAVGIVWKR